MLGWAHLARIYAQTNKALELAHHIAIWPWRGGNYDDTRISCTHHRPDMCIKVVHTMGNRSLNIGIDWWVSEGTDACNVVIITETCNIRIMIENVHTHIY